ncbi:MAG: hypothetical protein V4760_06180 [Bdellovibrionota bacterium]
MKFVASFVFAFVLVASSIAKADPGGWESSGGEIFRFAKNPWFVKNTGSVDYCVKIDRTSISADETTIREVVKEALDYWKRELLQPTTKSTIGYTQLATQTFSEVGTCAKDTPLRLVFGRGALENDEAKWLDERGHFIGVTVRQEYDLVQLKGSGFVFIASDFGPNAYTTYPNSGHLLPKAWEKRRILQYAVLHELGHVFGIPHTGTGLMSEVFLDQVLHNSFFQSYIDNPIQTFITPPLDFDICTLNGSFNATYFQIPTDTTCLKLEGKFANGQYEWNLYSRKGGVSTLAGTLRAMPITQLLAGAKPAVIVHLPPEQKVFTLQERFVNTYMIGPLFTEGTAKGIYKTVNSHRPIDVQVELRPDSIVMSGIVSGRMEQVLVYRPPTSMVLGPIGP